MGLTRKNGKVKIFSLNYNLTLDRFIKKIV